MKFNLTCIYMYFQRWFIQNSYPYLKISYPYLNRCHCLSQSVVYLNFKRFNSFGISNIHLQTLRSLLHWYVMHLCVIQKEFKRLKFKKNWSVWNSNILLTDLNNDNGLNMDKKFFNTDKNFEFQTLEFFLNFKLSFTNDTVTATLVCYAFVYTPWSNAGSTCIYMSSSISSAIKFSGSSLVTNIAQDKLPPKFLPFTAYNSLASFLASRTLTLYLITASPWAVYKQFHIMSTYKQIHS